MNLQLTVGASPEVMAALWAIAHALERIAPPWAGETLPGAEPPPRRPPRRRGTMSPEERRLHDNALAAERMRRRRAKKKGEQGASPALPVVDSPESATCSDSQPYTTPEPTSRASDGAARHVSDVVTIATGAVTDIVTIATNRNVQGEFKGESFDAVASSKKPTTPTQLPPKAPPQSLPVPTVAPLRATRAEAGHSARDRQAPAGAESVAMPVTRNSPVPVASPPPVTRNATAPVRAESMLTPDGQLVPPFSFRDAWEAAWLAHHGFAYAWDARRDDTASRKVLQLSGDKPGEVIRRLRNSFTYKAQPCDDVPSLARWWNRYGKTHGLHQQEPAKPPAAPQRDVGRSTAPACTCAVRGCDATAQDTWGQPLCLAHFDELERDVGRGNLSNEAAAAWLAERNGGRQ